jgi:hypothetical protein
MCCVGYTAAGGLCMLTDSGWVPASQQCCPRLRTLRCYIEAAQQQQQQQQYLSCQLHCNITVVW